MRYYQAHYNVTSYMPGFEELEPIHDQFDNKVWALPYKRSYNADDYEDNFIISLIVNDITIDNEDVPDYLDRSLKIWQIDEACQTRFNECALTECFVAMDCTNYCNCAFSEKKIRLDLNLERTYDFIKHTRTGIKESIVRSIDKKKASELAFNTLYKTKLNQELQNIYALDHRDYKEEFRLPLVYIVEGNAHSDAQEAIDILIGALKSTNRIESAHSFTLDIDKYSDWIDGGWTRFIEYLNPQFIRTIEGNTVVLRYGLYDTGNQYDVRAYKILAHMLDLIEGTLQTTQIILSIPEANADLRERLRKRLKRPVVIVSKDEGSSIIQRSFEDNLAILRENAKNEGIEPDEDLRKILFKKMQARSVDDLEDVYKEWTIYRKAKQIYPEYVDAIDEALDANEGKDESNAQAALESLVGLNTVKETIQSIILRIEMNAKLLEQGLPERPFSMHMAFLGSPGTGKTEVARLYGSILKDKGVLREGRLITVSGGRPFDVGKAFDAAKGSVLFIDEAYGLLGYDNTVTELIAQMESNRNDTVVILAGYKGRMDALFDSNPGFRSRLGETIMFPDYTPDELLKIFLHMCEQHEVILADGVLKAVRDRLERGGRRQDQGNARFVRSLFEKAIGAQQVRLAKRQRSDPDMDISVEDLETLKLEDIRQITEEKNRNSFLSARDELGSLVGLDEVKKLISAIMDLAKMQKIKRDNEMHTPFIPMHMFFKGNPGTGKTEVARLVGRILREEGVLSEGEFFECGKQDLVSPIVGATSEQVEALFQKARGSVIFIDEAYSLLSKTQGDPAEEAVTAIIDHMEKLRDEVVVIFAGYSEEMNQLIESNPGFASRVKYQIAFPDYGDEELVAILQHMADREGYVLARGVNSKVRSLAAMAKRQKDFGNARFIRNLLETAILNQSVRLASKLNSGSKDVSSLNTDELAKLLPSDFDWKPDMSDKPKIGFTE